MSAEPDRGENYERVSFTEAEEFLGAIAPVPSLRTETPSPDFIFRGQGDASKDLVPNALRPENGRTKALSLIAPMLGDTAVDQVFAEIALIKMFIDACDRAVIAIPGDGYDFRQTWMNDQQGELERAYRDPSKWPFPAHLPILAFAQHYGIPTRLLDWTSSAMVAAYFAASGAAASAGSENLVVWALNREFVHLYPRVVCVPMPGANSPRLGAQRGLFTIVRHESQRGGLIDVTPLAAALASDNEDVTKRKPLWKLTLPRTEALRLLYLCHLNGVDASTVYPGADGAARATIERAAWGRTDPTTGLSAVSKRPFARTIESQRGR